VGVRKALRPEPRDKFLDAATRGAHEDALFLCRGRGREVHVAIDLGHRVASTFGRAEVISPEGKSRRSDGAEQPITSACLVVDGEILRDRRSASPSQEGVDQAGFVRLDAAILGDFALDGFGRVSMSLRFA
jgi:hypothetical protein